MGARCVRVQAHVGRPACGIERPCHDRKRSDGVAAAGKAADDASSASRPSLSQPVWRLACSLLQASSNWISIAGSKHGHALDGGGHVGRNHGGLASRRRSMDRNRRSSNGDANALRAGATGAAHREPRRRSVEPAVSMATSGKGRYDAGRRHDGARGGGNQSRCASRIAEEITHQRPWPTLRGRDHRRTPCASARAQMAADPSPCRLRVVDESFADPVDSASADLSKTAGMTIAVLHGDSSSIPYL
jgi:hypothetical protein